MKEVEEQRGLSPRFESKLGEHCGLLNHYFIKYRTFTERCYNIFSVSTNGPVADSNRATRKLLLACAGTDPRVPVFPKFPLNCIVRLNTFHWESHKHYSVVQVKFDVGLHTNVYGLKRVDSEHFDETRFQVVEEDLSEV